MYQNNVIFSYDSIIGTDTQLNAKSFLGKLCKWLIIPAKEILLCIAILIFNIFYDCIY